jgi:6-phosphogluconolactonase (cycloisomerase 2 family)
MPPSITVFPLKANGDTAPVRIIQGSLTQLDWPVHISLDADREELYVANSVADDILVFRATDNGNVAPIRVLKGPRTGLGKPHGVFVDTKNDELVVANFGNHSSTVYKRDASGDAAPIRTIRAAPANTPAPMFGNIGTLSYDTKRDQLLVPN